MVEEEARLPSVLICKRSRRRTARDGERQARVSTTACSSSLRHGRVSLKADDEPKIFYNETPIQFSQDLVNHLSDHLATTETPPERQSTLDGHVRARIEIELSRLREEEDQVRQQIELALEKENMDREREMAGDASAAADADTDTIGDVKSSHTLLGDLEEVRSKIERYQTRQQLVEMPELKAKGEAVVSCYKSNPSTTLDCWHEVSEFRSAVSQVEQVCISHPIHPPFDSATDMPSRIAIHQLATVATSEYLFILRCP
ncbi:hypothetical protein EW146_g492 [Bondarzewia mesenterica]|uniref:Uncharacterized protein n=1 Tax=Bondarzewia mesenterica TaxID=1095465 RepID=A0A4S4M8X4_9AGAM|nr:hypothetical protein EW146_g492 [Bondarzewia mesenterica]